MCPVLLLLLLLPAALKSESSDNSTGLQFVIVFPENIAYYHPVVAKNELKIIALHESTTVVLRTSTRSIKTKTLGAGEQWNYTLVPNLELKREEISDKCLQISSDKLIIVQSISNKHSSVQTALIRSIDKLGTEYLIPPVPVIKGTTHPADTVTDAVTERGPFKLIIVNADRDNVVTVEGEQSKDISLQPYQVAQILVREKEVLRVVKAEQPVAVLFGHTCAVRQDCTCGQLYALLPPVKEAELKFYIPPALAKDAESQTFVLLSKKESTEVKAYNPKSLLIKTTGTAVLYRPGLLLSLIPETDFAACYVVSSFSEMQAHAVIVVHKDLTDGIHVGSLPLESPEWEELEGTDYVSTSVPVELKTVIWHASSTMAIYLMGKHLGGALFGNPAPVISKTPDFRGCVLSPEVVKIGEVAGGWRESLKYCKDHELDLVSLFEARFQRQIYNRIIQAKNDSLQDVWIGMRRSSLTGEWYWLSRDPVSDTNWAEGEPGMVHDGQCAIMSLKNGEDFGWRDESCCLDAHPVCYKKPVLMPM